MHVSIDYVGFVEPSLKMADLHSFVIDLSMEDTSFGGINKLWVGLKISVIISFDIFFCEIGVQWQWSSESLGV
jgi:hypothetical protein